MSGNLLINIDKIKSLITKPISNTIWSCEMLVSKPILNAF